MAAGLTPYAALPIATYEAARYLDHLDEFGTVTVGKRADLLLVTANPLHDITNAHQIIGVMVQGRWLPKAELQRLLQDIE